MTRRPAFTLLELLISSTLFVVIAVAIVGILAATSTVQETGKQSQVVTSQLQQSLSSLETTISRSVGTVHVFQSSTPGDNTFLILQTTLVGQDGSANGSRYEVICVNTGTGSGNSTGHGVLMQYVLPAGSTPNGTFPSNAVNTTGACGSTNTINTWFTTDGSPVTVNYLTDSDPLQSTDTNVSVTSLLIQPVEYWKTSLANAANPQGYSIELAGIFKGNAETRAGAITPPPVVVRGTAVVVTNPQVQNLSQ